MQYCHNEITMNSLSLSQIHFALSTSAISLLDISRTRTRMDIKSLRQKLNQTRHRQVCKGRTHTRMHLELSTSNIFFEHFLEHDRNDVHLNIYYYELKGKAPQISTVYVHERS